MDNDEYREKIVIDDLFTKRKITDDLKLKIYTKILHRAHARIKSTSRMRANQKFCFFLIPEFVLGIPRYDIAACTGYIIEKLIDNGFMIKYTYPNLLFISWQHYLPHYKRMEIKKRTGVSVDEYGNVVKKGDRKNKKTDLNSLLLKDMKPSILGNKAAKVTKNNTNFKDISTYKPTGNLIYNTNLLRQIENTVTGTETKKIIKPS